MKRFQTQTPINNRKKRRAYPELVPTPTEREATYNAALELVAIIDENLTRGVYHYRNKAGVLLTTLDEVINAILCDDLHLPAYQEEVQRGWIVPREMAA